MWFKNFMEDLRKNDGISYQFVPILRFIEKTGFIEDRHTDFESRMFLKLYVANISNETC